MMPAMTTCTTCGYAGGLGFVGRVGGITYFYHSQCGFYSASGKDFPTLKDAWNFIRGRYPDDAWRQAWDAKILEGKERKADRLFKKWQADELALRGGGR